MTKEFEQYIHDTRNEFVTAVNKLQWNTGFRTKCENLLIAYDQMKQALRKASVIGSGFSAFRSPKFNNKKMTHEEKVNYMKIAAGIVGYGFDKKGLDMLVSMYDLVLEKKGETDLHSIVKVESVVEEREKERVEAKKLKEKSDSTS